MPTHPMDTLAAWKRAVDDPQLHDLPYKVETNEEVWTCDREGEMRIFTPDGELDTSTLVPDFPRQVDRPRARS